MIFESEYTSEFLYDIVCLDEENYLLGDINNDGLINILDVVLIINLILGLSEPIENEVVISDINQDGIINILDIVLLVNMILGNADANLSTSDMNGDGILNVLDITILLNIILTN